MIYSMLLYSVVMAASGGDISEGFSDLGWFSLTDVFTRFDSIISIVIGVMTILAGLWFIFIVITGGLSIVTSAGNKQALEDGRKKIFNGLIGLVIVISSVFLIDIIGTIIGVDILGAGTILGNLRP